MLKIWHKVKIMTWSEKIMLHLSRYVSSAWTYLWCFHRAILSLSNVIAETAGDLSWPEVTSGTWRGWLFIMIFVQKKCVSIFYCIIVLMERSQNWLNVRLQTSKFRDRHFKDTSTDINRSQCRDDQLVGVPMANIKTFWGEVTWRDLVTWPWVTLSGSKMFNAFELFGRIIEGVASILALAGIFDSSATSSKKIANTTLIPQTAQNKCDRK